MTESRARVEFEPIGKRVEVRPGLTVLDAARQAGLLISSDCGGSGTCGRCRVVARDQHMLSNPSASEQGKLLAEELSTGYRLACQAVVLGDVKIDIPPASLTLGQRLQVEVQEQVVEGDGTSDERVIQAFDTYVSAPTLKDHRSDLHRVLDSLSADHHREGLSANPQAVRSLSKRLREHNWRVTTLVRGETIIGFLPPEAHPVGLAVDLGTTKVAAYLVDLETGKTLAAEGRSNPQISYGEDVVSRLSYAMNHPEGARVLPGSVHETLNELAQVLAEQAGIPTQQIAEACIVGNTAMTHLLLELPVGQLAMAPYVAATTTSQEVRAQDMHLPFADDARIYIPPCVAGYVGADLIAMALATEIGQDDRTVLGIDIGTNTEIILARRGVHRMTALSCASGPAFEGAHIHNGMRAATGAIERVWITDESKAIVQTIDPAPALGICGSGIIDAVSELRRVGAINEKGRFQANHPNVRENRARGGLEFLLVPAPENGIGEDITVTQTDVDEVQLAKGAIMAGITVLLEASGITPNDLDEVVLAGAFGTYLNLDTAISLGLLPRLPIGRYRQVGNAAGSGARKMLFSRSAREQAVEIANRIDYLELTVYPGFRRIFARSMKLADSSIKPTVG